MITMGCEVKDLFTGLRGRATGRAVYLNGCVQILIEPPVITGGEYKEIWIDEDRLHEVKPPIKSYNAKRKGGSHSKPPKRSVK